MKLGHYLVLGFIGSVAMAACGDDPASPPPAVASVFDNTLAHGDPGLPAAYYGPKCTFAHSVGKPPECISAVMTEVPAGLHLFLNFCVRNGVDECQRGTEAYVSLVLPIKKWQAGRVTEAVGGRAWLRLFDGRVHEARAEATRPLPIELEITERPVTGGGVTQLGVLRMTLPRLGGSGDPLMITANIP